MSSNLLVGSKEIHAPDQHLAHTQNCMCAFISLTLANVATDYHSWAGRGYAQDGGLRAYDFLTHFPSVLMLYRLLEMQVILTELLAKFSVSLPENSVIRARLSTVQFPVDNEGAKGLHLAVERLAN